MIFRRQTNSEPDTSEPFSPVGSEEYCGEWYIPGFSEEEYKNYRTYEKGYSMITAILHLVIGLIPAMGLNVGYGAAGYALTFALLIYQTVIQYRKPMEPTPMTHEQHQKRVEWPGTLCAIARLLVVLLMVADVMGTWQLKLSFSLWTVLQLVLLLLEALALQKLYRLQKTLPVEVSVDKPAM